jgi:hypothetical protein
MIGVVIGGCAFLAIPTIVGWLLFTGLQRGVMRSRFGTYSRATEPTWFWVTAGEYLTVIAFWLGCVAWMAAVTVRSH